MDNPKPGEWVALSARQYQRLVHLARRRLVGYELHAEDVVSRALIRWQSLPKDHPSARIETLIRSEAFSLLRSEHRRSEREQRAAIDRAREPRAQAPDLGDPTAAVLLRTALAQISARIGIDLGTTDIEIFELLLAGHSIADASRVTGLPRHVIKRSRIRWQAVLRILLDRQTATAGP